MAKGGLGPLTVQSSTSSPGAFVTTAKVVQVGQGEEQIEQIISSEHQGDHQQQSPTLWRIEFRGVSKLVRWASLKRPSPPHLPLPTASTTDTIAASSQLTPLDTSTDASQTNPSSTPSTSSSLTTSRSSSFVSYSSRKLRRRVTEEMTPTLSRSHSVRHDNTSSSASQDHNGAVKDDEDIPPVPKLPSEFAPPEIHHSTNTSTSRTASSSSFTSRIARSLSMSSSSAASANASSRTTTRTRTRPAPPAPSSDANSNMIAAKYVSTIIPPRASPLGADAVQNQTNNGQSNGIVSFRGAAAESLSAATPSSSSSHMYGTCLSVVPVFCACMCVCMCA